VLVVIFLVLFPVTINTEAGLRTTSPRLIEMLRSFGARPRQIFAYVDRIWRLIEDDVRNSVIEEHA
jgi:ABC-type nitrate/sulfonate/bicarbonate transport system permease component